MDDRDVAKALRAVLRRRFGPASQGFVLSRQSGGLESTCVMRASGLVRRNHGGVNRVALVAKHLDSVHSREVRIYRQLAHAGLALSPRCLGVVPCAQGSRLLLLELIESEAGWPWRDSEAAALVLKHLARLHRSFQLLPALAKEGWNYEDELLGAAERTLQAFEQRAPKLDSSLRRMGPSLRRLVRNLPRLRRTLLGCARFGQAALHGDVHTGNVILTVTKGRAQVLFIDWSRARKGSPLEDVSSLTESLGIWEPEARRRHDTLIRRYLTAHGHLGQLDEELRAHYWLAAASNVLAGSLLYYLGVIAGSGSPSCRLEEAHRAARAAGRIVRCAARYWG
jgi:thiamine kinase-like enzyme